MTENTITLNVRKENNIRYKIGEGKPISHQALLDMNEYQFDNFVDHMKIFRSQKRGAFITFAFDFWMSYQEITGFEIPKEK